MQFGIFSTPRSYLQHAVAVILLRLMNPEHVIEKKIMAIRSASDARRDGRQTITVLFLPDFRTPKPRIKLSSKLLGIAIALLPTDGMSLNG